MAHRQICATLYRGRDKEKVWVRYYNWMDTAMPRALALALHTGQDGDVVEFHSTELGFQIGVLKVQANNRVKLEYSPLVHSSPTLLRLL